MEITKQQRSLVETGRVIREPSSQFPWVVRRKAAPKKRAVIAKTESVEAEVPGGAMTDASNRRFHDDEVGDDVTSLSFPWFRLLWRVAEGPADLVMMGRRTPCHRWRLCRSFYNASSCSNGGTDSYPFRVMTLTLFCQWRLVDGILSWRRLPRTGPFLSPVACQIQRFGAEPRSHNSQVSWKGHYI